MTNLYDFEVKTIDGKNIKLENYKNKILLIVNLASKCGFTPQYEGLEKIYEKYKDMGFVVLGFPANNFFNQEPGSNEDIKQFCSLKYNVSFPMFSKISVKGKKIDPLYQFLTSRETNPEFGGNIKWNFTKFLVNKEGKIVGRFKSSDKPESSKIINQIEDLINR